MLPEALAEGNIPTKGEQHACYMHVTSTRFSGPFIMEFIGLIKG